MEAKEKAEALVDNFRSSIGTFGFVNFKRPAIQCAIICVKEILNMLPSVAENRTTRNYWNEVLTELNKM